MRVYIIALGLAGLYVLAAPADQPVLLNLAAGVLCMAVAMAVTGTGAKGTRQIAGRIASLTPFLLVVAGAAALFWGIHLYTEGTQILSDVGDFQTASIADAEMPLISCVLGGGLILAGCAQLYVRHR